MSFRSCLLSAALAGTFLMCAPAGAQDKKDTSFTVNDLKQVEAERDKVLKRLQKLKDRGLSTDRELQEIDEDLVRAAADSRRREAAAINTELELSGLELREVQAREQLLKDNEALSDILATLMTFSSRRPPALATNPDDVSDAIRAAILMGDIAPKLADEAEALAKELDDLARIQSNIRTERAELDRAERTLLARRQEIEALAEEKRQRRIELAKATSELEKQNLALAEKANSLQALLDALESKAPLGPSQKPPPPRKFASLKKNEPSPESKKPSASRVSTSFGSNSSVQRPVVGSLLTSYGTLEISGDRAKGQTWTTRLGAHVVAPKDGRVEYAGEFRTYGQMLILNLGDGYLVILAGMESIYPEVGQAILAGEPIGRMADRSNSSPKLYIELRRNGAPVDPESLLGRKS